MGEHHTPGTAINLYLDVFVELVLNILHCSLHILGLILSHVVIYLCA